MLFYFYRSFPFFYRNFSRFFRSCEASYRCSYKNLPADTQNLERKRPLQTAKVSFKTNDAFRLPRNAVKPLPAFSAVSIVVYLIAIKVFHVPFGVFEFSISVSPLSIEVLPNTFHKKDLRSLRRPPLPYSLMALFTAIDKIISSSKMGISSKVFLMCSRSVRLWASFPNGPTLNTGAFKCFIAWNGMLYWSP